jgi:hypothetical protein
MQVVLSPEYYLNKGEQTMNETCLKKAEIRMEYIPAHKYIGIWSEEAIGYGDFWAKNNCDEVCGIIESMKHISDPVVGCHMAGWHYVDGERKYFYGLGVSPDYDGEIPEGFSVKKFPGSYYLVFFHPPFDYLKDNNKVMEQVESLAWNYNIEKETFDSQRYQWNEEVCQDYQRHYPEVLGYEILRPVIRK